MSADSVCRTLILALVASACAAPERELESGRRYLSTTYNDTTFETFGRTDRAITGLLVAGYGDSVRFRIRTTSDALVSGVDVTWHPASKRGAKPATRRIGMPKGTLPLVAASVAFLEQVLRRARVVGGDSVSIPVMLIGTSLSLDVVTVMRNGSDSVVLVTQTAPDPRVGLHLAVDEQGRILGGVIPLSGTKIESVSEP